MQWRDGSCKMYVHSFFYIFFIFIFIFIFISYPHPSSPYFLSTGAPQILRTEVIIKLNFSYVHTSRDALRCSVHSGVISSPVFSPSPLTFLLTLNNVLDVWRMDASAYLIKINYFFPLSPTSRYSLVVAIDKFRGSHPRIEIEYGMALSLPSSKLQLCPPSHPSLSFFSLPSLLPFPFSRYLLFLQ